MPIWLKRMILVFQRLEDGLLVLILAGMVILTVIQILMRNLADSSLLWADPLIRIGVLWIGLLGAMIATRKGEHIAIDILNYYGSERQVKWGRALGALVSAGVAMLMAWVSLAFVQLEFEDGITAFGALPAWPFELIMPLAFLVIGIRYLIILIFPSVVEAEPQAGDADTL